MEERSSSSSSRLLLLLYCCMCDCADTGRQPYTFQEAAALLRVGLPSDLLYVLVAPSWGDALRDIVHVCTCVCYADYMTHILGRRLSLLVSNNLLLPLHSLTLK